MCQKISIVNTKIDLSWDKRERERERERKREREREREFPMQFCVAIHARSSRTAHDCLA